MEKHSESRLSYLFAHLPLLSSDLVFSDSSHLCFSTVHIVGSLASKLPSISLKAEDIQVQIGSKYQQHYHWRHMSMIQSLLKGEQARLER